MFVRESKNRFMDRSIRSGVPSWPFSIEKQVGGNGNS